MRPARSVAAWCDEVRLLLVDGSHAVVRCDVHAIAGRAADVLDALARLQLTARRHGGEIHLHGADAALIAILELVGFDQLVHGGAGPSGPDRDDA